MSMNDTTPSAPPSAPPSEEPVLRHRSTTEQPSSSSNHSGYTSFPDSPSTSSNPSSSTNAQSQSSSQQRENNENGSFECNICLDTAKDAVVSFCGHLFCWPCLHQWLETKPNRQVCPVCKAAISRDKVIPLYGRGSSREDPRDKLPPRPAGQRTEPEHYSSSNFPGFGFGDGGIHMSFGIGAFPFGFFASSFNFNDGRAHMNMNQEQPEDIFISRIFLWVALFFILWLLFA